MDSNSNLPGLMIACWCSMCRLYADSYGGHEYDGYRSCGGCKGSGCEGCNDSGLVLMEWVMV